MSDKPTYNPWAALQQFTAARIGIGRAGTSIPVNRLLEFKLAHAHARDAVYSKLDTESLHNDLQQFALPVLQLNTKAGYREQYLKRPDKGRQLHPHAVHQLKELSAAYDVVLIIADGLSATAVNCNAIPLIKALTPKLTEAGLHIAPICLLEQGRVAAGDDIAVALGAKISVILIGERPGLSAADSMGAYITYKPQHGLTDDARNCISNIRQGGLPPQVAAMKLFYLLQQVFTRKLSGVQLKDDTGDHFP